MRKIYLHIVSYEKYAFSFLIHGLEAVFADLCLIIMYLYINDDVIAHLCAREAVEYAFMAFLLVLGGSLLIDAVLKEGKRQ